VAAGGGYDDVAFGKLKEVCKDVEEGIVWVRKYKPFLGLRG
jgi:hypothetical protein